MDFRLIKKKNMLTKNALITISKISVDTFVKSKLIFLSGGSNNIFPKERKYPLKKRLTKDNALLHKSYFLTLTTLSRVAYRLPLHKNYKPLLYVTYLTKVVSKIKLLLQTHALILPFLYNKKFKKKSF